MLTHWCVQILFARAIVLYVFVVLLLQKDWLVPWSTATATAINYSRLLLLLYGFVVSSSGELLGLAADSANLRLFVKRLRIWIFQWTTLIFMTITKFICLLTISHHFIPIVVLRNRRWWPWVPRREIRLSCAATTLVYRNIKLVFVLEGTTSDHRVCQVDLRLLIFLVFNQRDTLHLLLSRFLQFRLFSLLDLLLRMKVDLRSIGANQSCLVDCLAGLLLSDCVIHFYIFESRKEM